MDLTFIKHSIAAAAILCSFVPDINGAIDNSVASPIRIKNANDFVPAAFTSDGQPMLSFTDFDRNTGEAAIQIIDSSITPVTDFVVPANPNTVTQYNEGRAFQNMYWETVKRDTLDYDGSDIENFIYENLGVKYSFIAKYCTDTYTSAGSVYGNRESSFEVLPSGVKVIKDFVYHTDSGYLISVNCSGNCDVEDVLDSESIHTPAYNIPPLMTLSLFNYDEGASSIGNIAVTQTLFNEDLDFEYVYPIYDESIHSQEFYFPNDYLYDFGYFAFSGEGFDHITPGKCIGFSIMSQNGTVLQPIKFDSGFNANGDNFMSLLIIGHKKYLSCNLISEDGTTYTMLYEISKETSTVESKAMFKASVYPTFVSRGENVTVDLGDSRHDRVSVAVADASGKITYSDNLNASERSLAIPSNKMSDGINIVTVNGNNYGMTSTKIVVK